MRQRKTVSILTLIILLTCPLMLQAAAYEGGADTPDELVERFRKASESGDIAGIAACLAPKDRAGMSFGLLFAASMMSAMGGIGAELGAGMSEAFSEDMSEEDRKKAEAEIEAVRAKTEASMARLEGILEKYGVAEMMEDDSPMPGIGADDPEAAMAAAFEGVDQLGLIRELAVVLDEIGDDNDEGEGEDEGEQSDTPEGGLVDLKIDGDRGTATWGDKPVELVRIDGKWFLSDPGGGQ